MLGVDMYCIGMLAYDVMALTFLCYQMCDDSKIQVTQFHYRQWPERSKPSSTVVLKLIDQVIKTVKSASDKPITVMCK